MLLKSEWRPAHQRLKCGNFPWHSSDRSAGLPGEGLAPVRRLLTLNNAGIGVFQSVHLILEGKSDLPARFRMQLIVPYKRQFRSVRTLRVETCVMRHA